VKCLEQRVQVKDPSKDAMIVPEALPRVIYSRDEKAMTEYGFGVLGADLTGGRTFGWPSGGRKR
jgi:hypothetical protein